MTAVMLGVAKDCVKGRWQSTKTARERKRESERRSQRLTQYEYECMSRRRLREIGRGVDSLSYNAREIKVDCLGERDTYKERQTERERDAHREVDFLREMEEDL